MKDSAEDRNLEGAALPTETSAQAGGSRIISRVLPPAVRLWIQSQVDAIENLVFQLEGRDREILSGYVPEVVVSADRAIYQGLHLSAVRVKASEIRINLGQVLRGKPLRLLQKFPIVGKVTLQEADVNASLQAPLLRDGLRDFFEKLVAGQRGGLDLHPYLPDLEAGESVQLQPAGVVISSDRLTLTLVPSKATSAGSPLTLQTHLTVREEHILVLQGSVLTRGNDLEPLALEDFELDLGSDVNIESLEIIPGRLELVGTVQVIPAD